MTCTMLRNKSDYIHAVTIKFMHNCKVTGRALESQLPVLPLNKTVHVGRWDTIQIYVISHSVTLRKHTFSYRERISLSCVNPSVHTAFLWIPWVFPSFCNIFTVFLYSNTLKHLHLVYPFLWLFKHSVFSQSQATVWKVNLAEKG